VVAGGFELVFFSMGSVSIKWLFCALTALFAQRRVKEMRADRNGAQARGARTVFSRTWARTAPPGPPLPPPAIFQTVLEFICRAAAVAGAGGFVFLEKADNQPDRGGGCDDEGGDGLGFGGHLLWKPLKIQFLTAKGRERARNSRPGELDDLFN
jgi:hypothetical protein